MESLFIETEKIASETLIIIGNGFDIAHGINSTCGSFRDWLLAKKESSLIDLMDTFLVIKEMCGMILKKHLANTMKRAYCHFAVQTKNLTMIIH